MGRPPLSEQLKALSSGTIGSIFGVSNYDEIDKILEKLIVFANNGKGFESWQEVIKAYMKETKGMRNIEVEGFRRITKAAARKLWQSDKFEFYMCPCRLRLGGGWHPEICVSELSKENCEGRTFDNFINTATVFHCTSETGKYLSYYIKAEGVVL